MKTAKILIPVVVIAAIGLFLLQNKKLEQNGDSSNKNSPNGSSNDSTNPPMLPAGAPQHEPKEETGILQKSDNFNKGNLMLITDVEKYHSKTNAVIYIQTSRDYSALLGKKVLVKFKEGAVFDFVLDDITALE